MKKTQVMILALLFSLAIPVLQPNAFAEGGKGEPTAADLGQMTIAPDQVNDQMLDSFIKADRRIREVQIKANREIFQILDQEGLSVGKYNGIVQAISKDEKLLKKVQDKIQKILAQEQKAQGK